MNVFLKVPCLKFNGTKNAITFTDNEMEAIEYIMQAAGRSIEGRAEDMDKTDKRALCLIDKWNKQVKI